MELLTHTMSRLDDMEQQARAHVERVMEKKDFLRVYMDRLDHVHVRKGRCTLAYSTRLSEEPATTNLEDFERRLHDIRTKMENFDGAYPL